MITRNWVINGVNLSSSLSYINHIVIQDVDKTLKLNTSIFNRQDSHGAIASYTLAEGRLFTFKGQIFGSTKIERQYGQNILNSLIKPIGLIGQESEYFQISWQDDGGNQYKTNAKVYSMPSYTNGLDSPVIDFTFELYAQESSFKGYTDKTQTGGYGIIGGFTLPVILPNEFDGIIGNFNVQNDGNFIAPCKIEIIGSILNPVIRNTTNNRYFGITGTTTNLIIDNRERPFIITDEGVDVSSNRMAGSNFIMLNTGSNNILITRDDAGTGEIVVNFYYNDTYINN